MAITPTVTRFPNIRLWIIANNLNQRVHRRSNLSRSPESAFQQSTWRYASRRMSRYLRHRFESASFHKTPIAHIQNPDAVTSSWKPYLSMIVRSLRKQSHEIDARWQRRFFQILESNVQKPKPLISYRHRAWQVCFQILTSHNYWIHRRSPNQCPVPQTWQHTLWRAAKLKKRLIMVTDIPPAWAICFRIILSDSLRSRKSGWHRLFTAISQRSF